MHEESIAIADQLSTFVKGRLVEMRVPKEYLEVFFQSEPITTPFRFKHSHGTAEFAPRLVSLVGEPTRDMRSAVFSKLIAGDYIDEVAKVSTISMTLYRVGQSPAIWGYHVHIVDELQILDSVQVKIPTVGAPQGHPEGMETNPLRELQYLHQMERVLTFWLDHMA